MNSAKLEDLASAIYEAIAPLVSTRRGRGTMTYAQLCERLADHWGELGPHDFWLAQALGRVTERCRANGLPTLSALVVNAGTGRPGAGYYPAAHPGLDNPNAKEEVWLREVELVLKTVYPTAWSDLSQRA